MNTVYYIDQKNKINQWRVFATFTNKENLKKAVKEFENTRFDFRVRKVESQELMRRINNKIEFFPKKKINARNQSRR